MASSKLKWFDVRAANSARDPSASRVRAPSGSPSPSRSRSCCHGGGNGTLSRLSSSSSSSLSRVSLSRVSLSRHSRSRLRGSSSTFRGLGVVATFGIIVPNSVIQ